MNNIKGVEELNEVLNQNKPVLLDFYADWCGPCQVLLPVIDKLAEEFDGEVEVRKINVDDNREIAGEFGIRSIPALFFIKDKEVVHQATGVRTESELRSKLQELVPQQV